VDRKTHKGYPRARRLLPRRRPPCRLRLGRPPGTTVSELNCYLGFTMWMAGAGVKPGFTYGATDEWSFRAIENPVPVHDLNATALHLLGINHKHLTFRFQGRDFRLTDLAGRVVQDILT